MQNSQNSAAKIASFFKPGEIEKYDKDFRLYLKKPSRRKICDFLVSANRFKQLAEVITGNFYLLPGIIANYAKKILTGKERLRSMEIAVDYNCNSKCEQCSCRLAYDSSKKRLSLDEFKNVIDQSIEMGAFQFNITGGEPLLQYEEVLELIKHIRLKRCYSHLCTNGLIMTLEKLKSLKEAGLNSLEMGLDSCVPEIHNNNRREQGYEKIMQVIKWAEELKIPVILNTVSTREKIKNHDLLALVKLAQQKKVSLQITPPCVTGAWRGKNEVLLGNEEKEYFWWLMKFNRARTDMFSSLTSVRCPAAREKIGIQPYGDVVSCPLIQITYGNIKQESLKQIVKKMLDDPYYSKINQCPPAFDREFIKKYLSD